MPIFEFKCIQCSHVFEQIFVGSNHNVDLECPECHGEDLERVVSATNFVMGSGTGGNKPKMTTKSCGSGNQCHTLDIPGPTK